MKSPCRGDDGPGASATFALCRFRRTLSGVHICSRCGQQNPEGARYCNACAAPLLDDAVPREARKLVTILFCDIVGSTATAERLDPEDVRAFLVPYYAHVRSELERFGGTVEKFTGDVVMAVFGARPRTRTTPSEPSAQRSRFETARRAGRTPAGQIGRDRRSARRAVAPSHRKASRRPWAM